MAECKETTDRNLSSQVSRLQEYETQYFGFAPRSFVDSMYNVTFDYTWQFLQITQQMIENQFPGVMSNEQLLKASEVILQTLTKAIDRCYDKLETYLLTNLMYIPNYVVLPEDAVQEEHSYTEADEDILDSEIETLKQKIHAAKYENACLRQEVQDCEMVQHEYDQYIARLRNIDKLCKETGVLDLHESLVFISRNADKLAAILDKPSPYATPSQSREAKQAAVKTLSEKFEGKKKPPEK